MFLTSYEYRDRVYSIRRCTLDDVEPSIERVLQYWNPEETDSQRGRMVNAVLTNNTYAVVDENDTVEVFAYFEPVNSTCIEGISLWWSSLDLFLILGWYFKCYLNIRYIKYCPHKDDAIPFSLFIEDNVIDAYKNRIDGAVHIDLYSPKCNKGQEIFDMLGVMEI